MVAPPPFRFVAATLTALCLSTTAWADSAGDAAVAAMDAAVNRAVTLVFDYQVDNQEPDKPLRVLAVKLQTNGASKLYEFTAPPDMQGTKVLILSPTQMYVYLPAFGKVRRIASHTHDQGFFGLAFSQDDLATTSYGVQYAGQIAAQTPAQYVLVLTAKDVPNAAYAKIEMTVAKDRMIPLQLKYFNAEGANIKTETRSNYSCAGAACTPGEIKMVDNVKGNWTRLVRKSWQQNVGGGFEIVSCAGRARLYAERNNKTSMAGTNPAARYGCRSRFSAGLEVWGDGNASMDKTCMGKACGLRGRRTVCSILFGLIGRRGRAACKVARASRGRTVLQGEGCL